MKCIDEHINWIKVSWMSDWAIQYVSEWPEMKYVIEHNSSDETLQTRSDLSCSDSESESDAAQSEDLPHDGDSDEEISIPSDDLKQNDVINDSELIINNE